MAPRHSLCDAAKRGDLEAVRKCIRAGESVNSAGDDGFTFPPPVDLDAYAKACRLPPAEETEDEREARFQVERAFGL